MSLESRIQKIEDEMAIRNLSARFADVCSPPDYEAFSKLWYSGDKYKPEWVLSAPFAMQASGGSDITTMLKNLIDTRDFFVQMVHSGVVDIQGEEATGRWILQEVAKGPEETTFYNNFAVYEDVMRKVDGKWYFVRRSYKYIFWDASPFEGKVFPLVRGP